MLNKDYKFPIKATGPSYAMRDGFWYGDSNFTWDFLAHWPVLTIEFAEIQTGRNLSAAAGSYELAEAELLKISRLSRSYIMSRLPVVSQKMLEYRVAKDTEVLEIILQFQLEILQTWGGYQSMYRVKDSENQSSIGQAAEDFIRGTDLFAVRYDWSIERYREDY